MVCVDGCTVVSTHSQMSGEEQPDRVERREEVDGEAAEWKTSVSISDLVAHFSYLLIMHVDGYKYACGFVV